MPGGRLNDTERQLKSWWDQRHARQYPLLAGLAIQGSPGLRGMSDVNLTFDYPLTVVSGKNGSGKTTLLALSALAFHSPQGHRPGNARRQPDSTGTTYYTFRDFFFQSSSDPDIAGVQITWSYRPDAEVRIRKQSEKWMTYARRPLRPVHYLGLSRAVPAIEQPPGYRTHFGARRSPRTRTLDSSFTEHLSYILNVPYRSVTVLNESKYSLNSADAGTRYTGFNMGAGEDAIIDLLWVLQQSRHESLIVIEEIEQGIHPEAVWRLAERLQQIILAKRLQVVVSTHSEHFIDAVPRVARILVDRQATSHIITRHPTTRLAMGSLSGRAMPEVDILCEDPFAAKVIQAALPMDLRRRCRIVAVGSASELTKYAKYQKISNPVPLVMVWDGNEDTNDIDRWRATSDMCSVPWAKLPTLFPPERAVIELLDNAEGYVILAQQLPPGTSPVEVQEILRRLHTLTDPHDIPYELGAIVGMETDESVLALARAVARHPQSPLRDLVGLVEGTLTTAQAAATRAK